MLILLLSLCSIVFALHSYLTWNFDYWRRRRVTGPTPRAYVGTFPKTAMLDKSSNYIEETTEIYRFVKLNNIITFEEFTDRLNSVSGDTFESIVSSVYLNIALQNY